MSKVVFISKKRAQWYIILAAAVILAGSYVTWQQTRAASAPFAEPQVVQMVVGEFSSTASGGKQLESYVFSPGTITVHKNQPVELRITGVSGQSHPFVIQGLDNVSGTVSKGKTTVVTFTPTKAGTYPIVCTTHSDPQTSIPMVGYLYVV